MTSRLHAMLGTWYPGGPVAAALAARIEALILDGRLTVDEKLPSERALAGELGHARATITHAYDRLAEAGYLSRVHGGGTRVALPHRISAVGDTDDSMIDFGTAAMGATPGLHEATLRALPLLAELRQRSGYTLDGLPLLRELIAQRYTDRGLPTTADHIMITSGAMHALTLVIAAFGRTGKSALVDQPTFPHPMATLRRAGHRLIPTPVTPEGWDVTHLTDVLHERKPHLGYLIPDFHNPTGATMTDQERERVAATARHSRTLMIVDETCAELNIDREWTPLPFAAHGPAITVGSLSKIAWGGLRIGWIRAEATQLSRIRAVRPSIDLGTALMEQCIAIELLSDIQPLLTHARERLVAGRDAVAAGISRIGGIHMPELHGGLSAWATLDEPIATSLSLAARARGLHLPPGPRFAATPVFEKNVRIPITWDPSIIADGLDRLAAARADVLAGRANLDETPLRDVV